jgi:phenylacetate-coenzyme A ligase PaaK-like adenylate-forming protein
MTGADSATGVEALFDQPTYALDEGGKTAALLPVLNALTRHHAQNCAPYGAVLDGYGVTPGQAARIEDIPFLPVRMFKRFALSSVQPDQVFKTLMSSGTTGQTPSRIMLDTKTAQLQAKALVKVMQSFIGEKRLPMLIIDHPSVVKDRRSFTARGAGILGLANFGRDHFYALDDESMALRLPEMTEWLAKHKDQTILMFGFTFMVWRYLAQALAREGRKLDLNDAILIHSGGWKKLQDEAVSNDAFKGELKRLAGVGRVHNFYGMVEQTGSIFVECEQGHLHAPVTGDVLVRDPRDWSVLPPGREGVIQVLSALPHSYPGHSLMTEDRGVLLGHDDCQCGRKGRFFKVFGRVPMAEMRGCSDTHASQAA